MKAFVTGGTGIVGSALLPRLLAGGWELTALTRDPAKPGLLQHPRLSYIGGDLLDLAAVEQSLDSIDRSEVVFHLAASLNYFGDAKKVLSVNVGGTALMAKLARRIGARRFVYASSIEAGGAFRRSEVPATSGYRDRPLTVYGHSKVLAEKEVIALKDHGVAPIALRIGNVYGPGWMNFIIEFARSLVDRGRLWEYLPLYGQRYLSPIWNEDVADGLMTAAVRDATGTEHLVGQAATVEEIFRLCADAMKLPFWSGKAKLSDWFYAAAPVRIGRWLGRGGGEFGYLLAPCWPRVHRCYGMEVASHRLAWQPQMPLREGIRQTLLWARENELLKF